MVVLTVLLVVGNTHRIYGNFAFVRIWQGNRGRELYHLVQGPESHSCSG